MSSSTPSRSSTKLGSSTPRVLQKTKTSSLRSLVAAKLMTMSLAPVPPAEVLTGLVVLVVFARPPLPPLPKPKPAPPLPANCPVVLGQVAPSEASAPTDQAPSSVLPHATVQSPSHRLQRHQELLPTVPDAELTTPGLPALHSRPDEPLATFTITFTIDVAREFPVQIDLAGLGCRPVRLPSERQRSSNRF